MTLEHKLQAAAEPWLAEEELTAGQEAALERLVRRRRKRSWGRWASAATVAASMAATFFFWPVLVSIASGAPLVGPFIAKWAQHDEGAHWAHEKGFVVPVNKSATDKGYTFRVESIMADAARTIIYYTVEGPDLNSSMRSPTLWTNFNLITRAGANGGSGRHDVVDGKLVGAVELWEPLPYPTTLLTVKATQVGDVEGDWSVSFMASRTELDRYAQVVPMDERWQGAGYNFQVGPMLIAPTQTVVEIRGYTDDAVQIREMELVADGEAVQGHGGSYIGPNVGDRSPAHYRWTFDRVHDGTESLILRVTDAVRWQKGGPKVPLSPGTRSEYGGVWYEFEAVEVGANGTGVTIRVPWSDETWKLHGHQRQWVLVDTDGNRHEVSGHSITPDHDSKTGIFRVAAAGSFTPAWLEAEIHAVPVTDTLEIAIPLQK